SPPQLVPQFRPQAFEPARMPAGLHPHTHRLTGQTAVEQLRLRHLFQSALSALSSFRIHKGDLLKPRVIITAYNPHVGSFSRALVVSAKNNFTRVGEPISS